MVALSNISDIPGTTTSLYPVLGAGSPSALEIADSVSSLPKPNTVSESLNDSNKSNWKNISVRALTLLSAGTLGVLTGFILTSVLTTPIGWGIMGIAGAAFLLGLAGSAYYGDSKELFETVSLSVSVFLIGLGAGLFVGANIFQGNDFINGPKGIEMMTGVGIFGFAQMALCLQVAILGKVK